jgi:hypothetical protein
MAPQRFVGELNALAPGELDRFPVVAGHHGLRPAREDTRVFTLLRDPALRAWSHYRALGPEGWRGDVAPHSFESFGAFLDDRVFGWMASEYQARWLAITPDATERSRIELPPGISDDGTVKVGIEDGELARRCSNTLRRCALTGTAERLDDFVAALGRLTGRRLAAPPRLNVGTQGDGLSPADAARVRAQSPVDVRLHAAADAALDHALETLPPLPPEREAALPHRYDMSEALLGTGWHARVHTPEVGWHRWTGPGTRSGLRLPVRLAGAAHLEVAVLSACDDAAVTSLRLSVQDRPVPHSLERRPIGVAAVADVELHRHRPLTLTVDVAHTRHLFDTATGGRSPDPAGLAIGSVSFTPAGGARS